MPRPPHHRRPHHPHPEWFENEERTRSLPEIAERLHKLATRLETGEAFKLGRTEVRPPQHCQFKIRYERLPKGELALKLEMKWDESDHFGDRPPDEELVIE